MCDGLKESYEWKGLKIVFAVKNSQPYASVLSGAAVLKTSDQETMEEVKNEIRDWLKDSKNIENAIIKNHQRFLQRKGINNVEAIGVYKAESVQRNRQTHCYSCARTLSSFEDLSCSACNWILCSCGACGCGFGSY